MLYCHYFIKRNPMFLFLQSILKLSFLILLTYNLQAADLNTSLVSGDKALYVKLHEKFKKTATKNDEMLLQETLLEKLINFQENENAPKKAASYDIPKDEQAAKSLFLTWIDILSKEKQLQQQIEALQGKMDTLKKQIDASDRKNPSLLTYQLQYALYTKNMKSLQQQIQTLHSEDEQLKSLLAQLPKTLLLKQKDLLNKREALLKDLALLENKYKTLQIKKERLILLGNAKQLDKLTKQMQEEQEERNNISMEIMSIDFLLFCDALQKKDQTAFSLEKEIFTHKIDKAGDDALRTLLKNMEREYLGIVNTIGGTTVQGVKYTADSIWKLLTKPLFEINETPVSTFKLILVLIVFMIGFLVGKFFKYALRKSGDDDETSHTLTSSSRMILSNLGYYIIMLITFLSGLKVLGINLSSLAIVAGALSVGIGFGLQNIVSNFVSGLILMFERSIKIGDYIELGENLRGHVTDIRMRSTTINTNSNIDVIVPNQNFVQNNVVNWTMNDDIRRFEIPFGVKYGTKPEVVIKVVLDALKNSGFTDIYTSRRRFSRVIMTGMGDSSVNFELFVWVKGHEILFPKRTASRFLILIYNALYANNIEIPFPQRDLHLRSVDEEVVSAIKSDRKPTMNEQKG